jgi:hypothetical protein
MKTLFLSLTLFTLLSCEKVAVTSIFDDVTKNEESPKLKCLGRYDISAGTLYVYNLNGHTIYIVEGDSSHYPVSITTN